MKIIAMIDMSGGNAEVGDMWTETKTFDDTEPLSAVTDWLRKHDNRKNVYLSIPDEERAKLDMGVPF